MSTTLKIEMMDISKLVPYKNNAKLHPQEQIDQIKSSIQQFGNNDPIAIDKDNVIIEGHGRMLALEQLGHKEVPVIKLGHLSDEQRKAYTLIHNQLTMNSGFDLELLKIELDDIVNIDMTEFDFDYDFPEDEEEVVEDEFDGEIPEEPKSKRGEIYQLGNHRLMCGDSTKEEDVQKLMGGARVDLLLTDPPYNVDYTGKTKDALKIENDKKDDSEFRQFLVDAFKAADSVMKPGAVFYIWHADSEGYNFRGACFDIDWQVRQCLIWNKNVMVMGRQDYHWKHEPCLYGWKPGGSHLWASDRKQTTVLNFDRPTVNKEHPTMKPIKLFDYQMQNNTKKEDVVLDLFGGSGTTLIAAEQNGRVSYTMEYDPRYIDVIINRWEELTGKKAVLVEEGAEV